MHFFIKPVWIFLFIKGSFIPVFSQQLLPDKDNYTKAAGSGLWTLDRSADDKFFITGGDDSLLRVYNGVTYELQRVYRMKDVIRHVKFHPNSYLIAISGRFPVIKLLDLMTNDTMDVQSLKYGARAVSWSPDGSLLAAADGAGLVHIWTIKGEKLRSITKPDNNSYLSLDWHPDGKQLIVSGDDIRIMDTSGRTMQVIKHRKEATGILTVRWHPSGDFFVSGDYGHHNEGIPSLLQFWSKDGKLIKTIINSKSEYRILSWSRDGKWLAGSGDVLRIYDQNGNILVHAKQERNVIWGLNWSMTGDKILLSDFSGRVKLYDRKGKLLKSIVDYK